MGKGESIQCYQPTKDGGKILNECRNGFFDRSRDMEIKILECIKNQGRSKDYILALKYLELYQKCLAQYDSCFYTNVPGVSNQFHCTCPYMYFGWIQPETFIKPTMKVGECKKLDQSTIYHLAGYSREAYEDAKYM